VCWKRRSVAPAESLLSNGTVSAKDISGQHLFLGYKPLVIGIPAGRNGELFDSLSGHQLISLFFNDEQSPIRLQN
jgi:hypothetical protein